ncbi:hypothetical protein A33O_23219 [Nitratireductor aquibiodomus RA22]|uniref:Uncharacterized protein n=1 Tax=Nitratireductor aquibiodomus RA22 TaxID=1189611 RepID=I5BQ66_9HYPH|nr:hypothetical protein A33O_23219 [Nitratireductor aquibiodomus RA22]
MGGGWMKTGPSVYAFCRWVQGQARDDDLPLPACREKVPAGGRGRRRFAIFSTSVGIPAIDCARPHFHLLPTNGEKGTFDAGLHSSNGA